MLGFKHLLKLWYQYVGLRIMPQGLCAYITRLYLINCIPYRAVQTNGTDYTQQGVLVKNISIYRELCVFVGVCLCYSSNNETQKYYDRSGTD